MSTSDKKMGNSYGLQGYRAGQPPSDTVCMTCYFYKYLDSSKNHRGLCYVLHTFMCARSSSLRGLWAVGIWDMGIKKHLIQILGLRPANVTRKVVPSKRLTKNSLSTLDKEFDKEIISLSKYLSKG